MKWFTKNRAYTNFANRAIDALTPPIIRDSRWFAFMMYYPFFKDKTRYYIEFRNNPHLLTAEEYQQYYELTASALVRDTDLSPKCFHKLIEDIQGKKVLEVGCGHGLLAKTLSKKNKVTAVDMIIEEGLQQENPQIEFFTSVLENLPFGNKQFEVTVCTHTLEHVQDFEKCIAELRRVTKEQLYIVVPLQRPARVTPDLHLSYFPYPESFLVRIRPKKDAFEFHVLEGDLYYRETI